MKAYITKDGQAGGIAFDLPKIRPKPGEIYTWTTSAMTVGGVTYDKGDTMELLELTTESPFGWHCSSGNWRVRSKIGVSIWTTIEESITSGQLVKVQEVVQGKTIWERLTSD